MFSLQAFSQNNLNINESDFGLISARIGYYHYLNEILKKKN